MKRLKGLQRCDKCASRKGCLIYTPGKEVIDCYGFIKELRELSKRRLQKKTIVATTTK